jgi:tetratricopeptide (TPR) repeat protein
VPARHQALRNAIQWSYDLLDSEEQRVFMSLGVFNGGCTAEAAQAVLGESIAVLPVLERLHQASLLQQQTVADETRFLMLETIREFALEQLLMRGEPEAAGERHMEYYARFSMTVYVELLRPEAPRWRARVGPEQDNIRAAFRWAMEHQAYTTALRIATGVWRFHWMAGLFREGLERLRAALAYREQAPWDVQANALRAAGTLAGGLNDFACARQWLEAAVQVGRRLDNVHMIQQGLTNLGYALIQQGELEAALLHLEEAITLARQTAEPNVVKFPLGILAGLHRRLGNYAQAQAMSEECLRINQARQDPEGTADALWTLGRIVNDQGDTLRAQQLGQEALALHRSLNHLFGMGLDYALLGDISRTQGDYAKALAHYHHSLSLWRNIENSSNSAMVLDSIAQILNYQGGSALGATLIGAAAVIRERVSVKLAVNEQASRDTTIRACQVALGETAFVAAWTAGRRLTLGQAIDLALKPLAPAAAPFAQPQAT